MTPFTPDFEKYYNYINYFNGFDIEIGYGQGVIYYYLVSFFLKRKIDLISEILTAIILISLFIL